jgi:hypothetical protein
MVDKEQNGLTEALCHRIVMVDKEQISLTEAKKTHFVHIIYYAFYYYAICASSLC